MKKLIFTVYFCSFIFYSFEQGGVGPSNVIIPKNNPSAGVIDGIYEKKDLLAKKRTIPLEHVRENDVTWERRTWSYIDLRERINYSLYYPNEEIDISSGEIKRGAQGRYSLYFILKTALEKGQLIGYFDTKEGSIETGTFGKEEGGDAFTMPASTKGEINELLGEYTKGNAADKTLFEKEAINPKTKNTELVFHKKGAKLETKVFGTKNRDDALVFDPTTETFDPKLAELDPVGGQPATVTCRIDKTTFYEPKRIVKYFLKEDWIFDKERSVMDVRIIGLAPVIIDSTSGKEKVLFWVYFPHARDILKNYYAYQPETSIGSDFDELFLMRKFNSVVYKASSLQDRKIEETRFGIESLYESEKVKNEIRVLEHDVWNF